ncbi:MAG: MlaD family protein [Actinomycetota bacterium]
MRLTSRVVINTVAFIVLGLGLAGLLAVKVLPTVFGKTYSVYAIFPDAGGVAPNQEVTYRGVQVGRVGAMTLTEDAVKIQMKIESKYHIPKVGTHARVLFKSAVGEQFIDLLPEKDGSPFFNKNDVIPITMTSIPAQIEDLLRELNAVLRSVDPKALGQLVHELGVGLTGHGKDLSDTIKGLDVLAKIGAERRSEVGSLIDNAADIQDSFNGSSEDFVRAISSLKVVLETVAARRGDLERTVRAMDGFDTQILALLDHRKAELNRILSGLGVVVRNSHKQLDDLDKLLRYLGAFLADAHETYVAPYFTFNLLTNTENPACVYDPSSRPVHAVTDPTVDPPENDFDCAGITATSSSTAIAALDPALRAQLDRISWLQLFTLGY